MRLAACFFGFAVAAVQADAHAQCPPAGFETVKDFNLNGFISKRWYVQQQMEVSYLPKSRNRCVYADYSLKKGSLWGYEVQVRNHAEDVAPPHEVSDSGNKLCAKVVDEKRGKLKVAPCWLPPVFAGKYWVLDFNEEQGYALISGGPPKKSGEGGCRTGSGTNGSGLWIFTRQQQREQALVDKVRGIAASKGFDLSVLHDVDQTCNGKATASQASVILP
jgi:lipocalin